MIQLTFGLRQAVVIATHARQTQNLTKHPKASLQYVSRLHMRGPRMHWLSMYSDTEGRFIRLQHKAVAQAVWKPEKYKETSHTTCCHYDNQAESFSLISCLSTQHRNPIAFKSYATRQWIRSARLLTHLQNKIHRQIFLFIYLFSGNFLGRFILEGCWRRLERVCFVRWGQL